MDDREREVWLWVARIDAALFFAAVVLWLIALGFL
jgi:hypothetical protein